MKRKSSARKSTARKSTRRSNATKGAVKAKTRTVTRLNATDNQKIKVVGEHSRRAGSRYNGCYELMKKVGTVGAYRKKGGDQDALRDAVKEGYVRLSA